MENNQVETSAVAVAVQATAIPLEEKQKRSQDLTPNMNKCVINPNGRGSVEYAKARTAINADYQHIFAFNQPMAKQVRKKAKRTVVSFLKGNVTKNEEGKFIVTFPDKSIARL